VRLTLGSIAIAAALLAAPAWAGDAFTDAVQAAYVPYRAALFRTNSKAQAGSEQAVAEARARFAALSQRYTAAPPVPYDRDAEFAATLKKIDAILAQAEAQIRDRQLAQGHETLEGVRDLLSGLRRRSGVVVYSDHMNAYHDAMEHAIDDAERTLARPGGMLTLAGQAGVLHYLARRLKTEAPAELTRDAEFDPLVDAVQGSVNGLRDAVVRQDEAAARAALGKLKAPYSKLFLKFG
jgi:hypothetical protein